MAIFIPFFFGIWFGVSLGAFLTIHGIQKKYLVENEDQLKKFLKLN